MRIPYKGAGIALYYTKNSEKFVLLGLRSDHPFHKRWSVPGGYYLKDINESSFDNATRELYEETGISLSSIVARYKSEWSLKLPLFDYTTYIFEIDNPITDLKPNEFYELKWIHLNELKKYRLRPYTKQELNFLYKDHR